MADWGRGTADAQGWDAEERFEEIKQAILENYRALELTRCPGPRRTHARPNCSRTGTTAGFTSDRRCQFAPSTTSVWPVMKRA